jgi:hypothetical protein
MDADDQRMRFEKHKNRRDEQFWFTAATVGFNGILLSATGEPSLFAISSATLISVFAAYLVLTRWVAAAERQPTDAPSAKTASAVARLCYTIREIQTAVLSLPYVFAELSGSCFYLFLIFATLLGVVLSHWHALAAALPFRSE